MKRILWIVVIGMFCLSACSGMLSTPTCDGTYPRTSTGIPPYFDSLWPAPGSVISQRCYQLYLSDEYDIYNGIGVWILVGQVDAGKIDLTAVLIPYRTDLFLDDNLVSSEYLIVGSTLVDHFYIDEQGNEIHLGPGSHWLTWTPDLNPGRHAARIEITRVKGDILEYSWHFYIINNSSIVLTIAAMCLIIIIPVVIVRRISRNRSMQ